MVRRPIALGAALLTLLAAGCTGEAAPPPASPSTPAPSASATPSPTPSSEPDVMTPPQRPEAMATPSAAGAAAAASYFLQLYPYALATGDVAEWNEMSAETCTFCSEIRDEVSELHGAGGHSIGGLTVLTAEGKDLGGNNWYASRVTVRIAPSVDLDASGAVLREDDGGDYDLDLAMTWSDGWVIDSVGPAPTPSAP